MTNLSSTVQLRERFSTLWKSRYAPFRASATGLGMRALSALLLSFVLCVNFASADPLASRDSARRYAKVIPIQEVIDEMLGYYLRNVSLKGKTNVVNEVRSRLNNDKLLETYIDILVSIYTTEELDALADFYSSPIGASANSKRWQVVDKHYMFREEVERAVRQATSDLQSNLTK